MTVVTPKKGNYVLSCLYHMQVHVHVQVNPKLNFIFLPYKTSNDPENNKHLPSYNNWHNKINKNKPIYSKFKNKNKTKTKRKRHPHLVFWVSFQVMVIWIPYVPEFARQRYLHAWHLDVFSCCMRRIPSQIYALTFKSIKDISIHVENIVPAFKCRIIQLTMDITRPVYILMEIYNATAI